MALFNFSRKPSKSQTGAIPPPASPGQPPIAKPKTLNDLEQEIEAETKAVKASVAPPNPRAPRSAKRFLNQLTWTALLLSLPISALWVVNLPYPPLRRAIAQNAPMLLLPSYLSMNYSFRESLVAIEKAKQLINNPTSPKDLEEGEIALNAAKQRLDELPSRLDNWTDNYYWYSWRLSPFALNAARSDLGQLQAKLFQEKNAQVALAQVEQALNTAKQQQVQPSTSANQQRAIETWQAAMINSNRFLEKH